MTVVSIICLCIFKNYQISEILQDYLQGITPLPYSWFIYAIIYQYIVFYIACKIGQNNLSRILIISSILTILSIFGLYVADFGCYWYKSQPAFILGMIVAVYENKLCEVLGKYTFIVIIVVLIAMSMGTISSCLTFIPYNVAQFIFPNLMPLLILFMIYAYGAITNKVIRYLGVISLEIYLVQGFVMTAVGTFKFSWLAFALLVLLLVIPLSAIVHKFGNIISSNSINK